MSSWEVQRGVWVHAQSGALERCVKVERPKAMGAKVAAGLWNASSERISLGLHISLPAWSAGLRWQPSNLICQKDRLLAAVLTLRPAAQSNLWKSQFPPPPRRSQQVLSVKQENPTFYATLTLWHDTGVVLCEWLPNEFMDIHAAPASDKLLSLTLKLFVTLFTAPRCTLHTSEATRVRKAHGGQKIWLT